MDKNEFIERLIASVQLHPVLYDKSNKNYFNILVKTKVWKTIAKQCDETESKCKHRWKLLRQRYAKETKKIKCSSGSGQVNKKTWCYFDSLGFLKESTAPRRTRDNLTEDNSRATNEANSDYADNSLNDSDAFYNFIGEDDRFSRKSKRSKSEFGLNEIGEAAKSLQVAAEQLIARVPAEKPSLVSAQLKAMELLVEDLPPDAQDKFFAKMYVELMDMRSQARQNQK